MGLYRSPKNTPLLRTRYLTSENGINVAGVVGGMKVDSLDALPAYLFPVKPLCPQIQARVLGLDNSKINERISPVMVRGGSSYFLIKIFKHL